MRTASKRRRRLGVREDILQYRTPLPGPLYCDTSALLKLYVREPGTEEFNRLMMGRGDVVVSDLVLTEIASALSRRVRQGATSLEIAHRLHQEILARVDAGIFERVALTRDVHRKAEHFLFGLAGVPLRSVDALHLALATAANAASMASFDSRLAAAARMVGLATHPAERRAP